MSRIANLFHSGRLEDILRAYDRAPTHFAQKDLHFLVASYFFLGRLTEGEAALHACRKKIKADQLACCYFFLTIAKTRISIYSEAEKALKELQRLERYNKKSEIQFFTRQAQGFYLYYRGDYTACVQKAKEALLSAQKTKNAYYRALSTDLLGQAMIHLGSIQAGLKHVKDAYSTLEGIGHHSLHNAIKAAHLCYQAQFGLSPHTIVKELETLQSQAQFQDSYSQANIGLELARQYILRSQYSAARLCLEHIAPLIYQQENRRQEITLNLRLAELYFHWREFFQAQHFTRAARRCLSYEVDSIFEIRILGMEYKLAKALGRPDSAISNRLIELSPKFHLQVNQQILNRNGSTLSSPTSAEDVLGQFIDAIGAGTEPDQIVQIVTSPYLGFLAAQSTWKITGTLILDITPGSLTLFSRSGVEYKKQGLTSQTRKLLMLLQNPQSKEQLIEAVWGYQYDPLRHDSVLYAAIANLRKILGPLGEHLRTTETGYVLEAFIVHTTKAADPLVNTSSSLTAHPLPTLPLDLNYRQIQILEGLHEWRFIDVKNCQKIFQVSGITASRDLSDLFSKQWIERVGKGRSTKYILKTRNHGDHRRDHDQR